MNDRMLFDRGPIRRPAGAWLVTSVGRGLRTHPLVTTLCIAAVAVAAASALMLLLLTGLALVAVMAVGVIGYEMGRSLLRQGRIDGRSVRRSTFRLAGDTTRRRTELLRRYLAAVEEFSRLTDIAITWPIDAPARRRRLRETASDARELSEVAHDLADTWKGEREIAICVYELESASELLLRYLRLLQDAAAHRHSAEALRWRREELGRARDALTEHLRSADFRVQESAGSRQ